MMLWMKRRRFLLAGSLFIASAPLFAQGARRFRVACLWANDPESIVSLEKAFVDGLRDLGYVAGRNIVLEMRYARGDNSRLAALADELIALKPDVVVGIESVGVTMRKKTTTVPIVLIAAPDPVAAGLVRSLARPGTNVTGLAYRLDELIAKHIEILTEITPGMSRVALLDYAAAVGDPGQPGVMRNERYARTAAGARGLDLVVARMRDSATLREAFSELERARPGGLVVAANAATYRLRSEIVREARRSKLPSVSSLPWADAGGVIAYGPDWPANYRYAATFVDRILKGANPADLPLEHPGSFEVVVNMRAAREIGITIPSSIALRANRIIE